ncbi:hypothetical protein C0J52_09027 [Blattella germanica]|nr:hypothetical protein C0J52_09027 [Blattella germanica]
MFFTVFARMLMEMAIDVRGDNELGIRGIRNSDEKYGSLRHQLSGIEPIFPLLPRQDMQCGELTFSTHIELNGMKPFAVTQEESQIGNAPVTSCEQRSAVIALRNEGFSIREIAKKLHLKRSTVSDTIKMFCETGSNKYRVRSGRPRVTLKSEDQSLNKMIVRVQASRKPVETSVSGGKEEECSEEGRRLREKIDDADDEFGSFDNGGDGGSLVDGDSVKRGPEDFGAKLARPKPLVKHATCIAYILQNRYHTKQPGNPFISIACSFDKVTTKKITDNHGKGKKRYFIITDTSKFCQDINQNLQIKMGRPHQYDGNGLESEKNARFTRREGVLQINVSFKPSELALPYLHRATEEKCGLSIGASCVTLAQSNHTFGVNNVVTSKQLREMAFSASSVNCLRQCNFRKELQQDPYLLYTCRSGIKPRQAEESVIKHVKETEVINMIKLQYCDVQLSTTFKTKRPEFIAFLNDERATLEEQEADIEQLEQRLDKVLKMCGLMVDVGKNYVAQQSQFANSLWDLSTYFRDDTDAMVCLNKLIHALQEMNKFQTILLDQASRTILKNLTAFIKG